MPTPKKTQAEKNPTRVIRSRMLAMGRRPSGLTMTELAKLVRHPLSTVSQAVNTARFPRVRAKILEALDV